MKTFNSSDGRKWTLAMTIGEAAKIKSRLEIDILQPESVTEGKTLADRLASDDLLLGETIACMLEGQFRERGISGEEVYSVFSGETLKNATSAFFEELIDFFRQRGRTDRSELITKIYSALKESVRIVTERLSSISTQVQIQAMEAEADRLFGKPSGSSPEQSESTQEE